MFMRRKIIIADFFREKKMGITIICLTLLVAIMLAIVSTTASAASRVSADGIDVSAYVPSLFHNDSLFVYDDIMPLIEKDGDFYIPINLLRFLHDITMNSQDNYKDLFIIQYGGNRYISFNVSSGIAETSARKIIKCNVYIISGITYVPAKIVADSLGLTWEYNEQYKSGRIKELRAKKTFAELLAPYIDLIPTTAAPTPPPTTTPAIPQPTTTAPTPPPTTTAVPQPTTPPIKPQPTTTSNPTNPPHSSSPGISDINPTTTENKPTLPTTSEPPTAPTAIPVTEEPTTAENTRTIENYLMFYAAGNSENYDKASKIDGVLEILGEKNMRATFFLSENEITDSPDILRKIYASGHELGIRISADVKENMLVELEAVNDIIYSVVKHKTRFCMFEGSVKALYSVDKSDIDIIATNIANTEDMLKQHGYYLCAGSVNIFDLRNLRDETSMINFMKQRRSNIFIFDLNDGYENYLELSAQAAETKFYINFSYINSADIENIKRRINADNTNE